MNCYYDVFFLVAMHAIGVNVVWMFTKMKYYVYMCKTNIDMFFMVINNTGWRLQEWKKLEVDLSWLNFSILLYVNKILQDE